MHMPHPHKPWFLSKNAIAGIGVGLIGASIFFYRQSNISVLHAFQVGIVGFFLFMFAKHKRHHHHGHHGYHHYGGHHRKKHH